MAAAPACVTALTITMTRGGVEASCCIGGFTGSSDSPSTSRFHPRILCLVIQPLIISAHNQTRKKSPTFTPEQNAPPILEARLPGSSPNPYRRPRGSTQTPRTLTRRQRADAVHSDPRGQSRASVPGTPALSARQEGTAQGGQGAHSAESALRDSPWEAGVAESEDERSKARTRLVD